MPGDVRAEIPAMMDVGGSNRRERGVGVNPRISIERGAVQLVPGNVAIAELRMPLVLPTNARVPQSLISSIETRGGNGDRRVCSFRDRPARSWRQVALFKRS